MSDEYREAGADLETGYESVRPIKSHVARTKVKGAIDSIGAFDGMFDLSVLDMKGPVLISRTNGVSARLPVASEMGKHDTVGIDAVAICTSDIPIQGIAPIFFLDYLAVGKNGPKKVEQLIEGVTDGCVQAGRALIDGETAEMPGMHGVKHYDIAGFCVGVVDKCDLLDRQKIKEGNVLIGLPSTDIHSNGFSLIRKVLLKDAGLDLHREYEEIGSQKLGNVLLTPTKVYVKAIEHLLDKVDIEGMSHITGGSFYENVPRMLKEGQGVTIDTTAYPHKPIFDMIAKYGNIPMGEMCNVFGMNIDFMIAVDKKGMDTAQSLLKEIHEESYVIGEITNSGSVDAKW